VKAPALFFTIYFCQMIIDHISLRAPMTNINNTGYVLSILFFLIQRAILIIVHKNLFSSCKYEVDFYFQTLPIRGECLLFVWTRFSVSLERLSGTVSSYLKRSDLRSEACCQKRYESQFDWSLERDLWTGFKTGFYCSWYNRVPLRIWTVEL
jgi:hypothetical protein